MITKFVNNQIAKETLIQLPEGNQSDARWLNPNDQYWTTLQLDTQTPSHLYHPAYFRHSIH